MQWLAHARTPDETAADLGSARRAAGQWVSALASQISELPLPVSSDDIMSEWPFWLESVGSDAASRELAITAPGTHAYPGGESNLRISNDSGLDVGSDDRYFNLRFSSGAQRWIDEALATAAEGIREQSRLAQLLSEMWEDLTTDADAGEQFQFEIAEQVDLRVQSHVSQSGFWPAAAFDAVVEVVRDRLIDRARRQDSAERGNTRGWMRVESAYERYTRRQLVIRAFDEPEVHLHISAQRRIAEALDTWRRTGPQTRLIISSHSATFLGRPEWQTHHLHTEKGRTAIRRISGTATAAHGALARDLGLTRGELLAGITAVLIVEGEHDRHILNAFFRNDLHDAGIAIVCMRGTDNLLATADLDFINRYLDVPIHLLLDNTSVPRIRSERPATAEERAARDLLDRTTSRHIIGLDRPDIIAYLDEAVVQRIHPLFPGWDTEIMAYRDQGAHSFKEWLYQRPHRVNLRDLPRIKPVIQAMTAEHRSLGAELVRKINGLISDPSR